jgi:hypothetical protein
VQILPVSQVLLQLIQEHSDKTKQVMYGLWFVNVSNQARQDIQLFWQQAVFTKTQTGMCMYERRCWHWAIKVCKYLHWGKQETQAIVRGRTTKSKKPICVHARASQACCTSLTEHVQMNGNTEHVKNNCSTQRCSQIIDDIAHLKKHPPYTVYL